MFFYLLLLSCLSEIYSTKLDYEDQYNKIYESLHITNQTAFNETISKMEMDMENIMTEIIDTLFILPSGNEVLDNIIKKYIFKKLLEIDEQDWYQEAMNIVLILIKKGIYLTRQLEIIDEKEFKILIFFTFILIIIIINCFNKINKKPKIIIKKDENTITELNDNISRLEQSVKKKNNKIKDLELTNKLLKKENEFKKINENKTINLHQPNIVEVNKQESSIQRQKRKAAAKASKKK